MALAGTAAIVTGAFGGIGQAIVGALLEAGANVLAVDLHIKEDREEWLEARDTGKIKFRAGNVTKESDVAAYTEHAVAVFGRLDVVVLSAGILPTPVPWIDCDVAAFDRTMAINAKGVFLGAKHAARVMAPFAKERQEKGGASIVIISSIAGLRPRPTTSPYAISKFAVRGLCLSLALELRPKSIRVNAVFPGVTDSAMLRALPDDYRRKAIEGVPMLRAGSTKEQADAVVFLASPDAAFLSGVNLPVHGGITPS